MLKPQPPQIYSKIQTLSRCDWIIMCYCLVSKKISSQMVQLVGGFPSTFLSLCSFLICYLDVLFWYTAWTINYT